jgi:hypothetical protein
MPEHLPRSVPRTPETPGERLDREFKEITDRHDELNGCASVTENDPVNHPKHYTSHPSGVECIQITEHMGFNLGNALKYIWRADLKEDPIEDLEKARWYVDRELMKRKPKP